MAIQENSFLFTGSIGKISAYRMQGHDKIIVRTKGGATKKKIKTAAAFEPTRRLNNEWKAVTQATAQIRAGFYALRPMADYNISGPLNALIKKVQVADTLHPTGSRWILFSRQPDFISHFSFNRKTLFDTVIRQPLSVNIDPVSGAAGIDIPALQPATSFFPHPHYPYYRLVLALAALSDYVCDETGLNYNAVFPDFPTCEPVITPWLVSAMPQPPASYRLEPAAAFPPGAGMILIFGAGIQYGMPSADGSIQPASHAGAARILKSVAREA